MTTKRTNRALSSTRRWTAGVLLTSTLATGGLGLRLAAAYASSQSGTVAAGAATTGTAAAGTSSDSSSSGSSFGASGSLSSSTGSAPTTTRGS